MRSETCVLLCQSVAKNGQIRDDSHKLDGGGKGRACAFASGQTAFEQDALLISLALVQKWVYRQRMESTSDSAAIYRTAHFRKLMVLTKCTNQTPGYHEFCRLRAVETLEPGLWLTATFLDGSTRRFRPDKIRVATRDEERYANELLAASAPF